MDYTIQIQVRANLLLQGALVSSVSDRNGPVPSALWDTRGEAESGSHEASEVQQSEVSTLKGTGL